MRTQLHGEIFLATCASFSRISVSASGEVRRWQSHATSGDISLSARSPTDAADESLAGPALVSQWEIAATRGRGWIGTEWVMCSSMEAHSAFSANWRCRVCSSFWVFVFKVLKE